MSTSEATLSSSSSLLGGEGEGGLENKEDEQEPKNPSDCRPETVATIENHEQNLEKEDSPNQLPNSSSSAATATETTAITTETTLEEEPPSQSNEAAAAHEEVDSLFQSTDSAEVSLVDPKIASTTGPAVATSETTAAPSTENTDDDVFSSVAVAVDEADSATNTNATTNVLQFVSAEQDQQKQIHVSSLSLQPLLASPDTNNTITEHRQQPPPPQESPKQTPAAASYFSFSECLYGVPEEHDVLWDEFLSQDDDDDFDDYDDDSDEEKDESSNDEEKEESNDAEKKRPLSPKEKEQRRLGRSIRRLEQILWKRQARVRQHVISISPVRRLAALGIPDEGSHRAVVWRVLLGFLPTENIDDWSTAVAQLRYQRYIQLCRQWFVWNDWDYGRSLRGFQSCSHRHGAMRRQQIQDDTTTENTESSHNAVDGNDAIVELSVHTDDAYQSFSVHATTIPNNNDNIANMPTAEVNSAGDRQNTQNHHQATPNTNTIPNLPGRRRTRPTANVFCDNPNVLDHIPLEIQKAWADQGKDLHILQSLMKSFNALKLPFSAEVISTTTTDDMESNDSRSAAVKEFIDSLILLDEIHKDVVRTHADLSFFLDPHDDLGRRRYAAIERILFVWAKENKETGIKYVQGMNEIVSVLYYVMANDERTEWANGAEADAYILFQALLKPSEGLRDLFCPELDLVSTSGIRGQLANLQQLLALHDPALYEHLVELGLGDASFYAVRWFTTLLSREFLLPDTIRLWDSMLASTHKDNFLRYVCVTLLLNIRHALLHNAGDLASAISLLQQYPPLQAVFHNSNSSNSHTACASMDQLLESSRCLYWYETQITLVCHKAQISVHEALLAFPPPQNIRNSLIMAFGWPKGRMAPQVVQYTHTERVQQATEAVASKARNFYKRMFFGGGRDSGGGSMNNNNNKSKETEPISNLEHLNDEEDRSNDNNNDSTKIAEPDLPDIYMEAILNTDSDTTTSTTTTSNTTTVVAAAASSLDLV